MEIGRIQQSLSDTGQKKWSEIEKKSLSGFVLFVSLMITSVLLIGESRHQETSAGRHRLQLSAVSECTQSLLLGLVTIRCNR